VQVRSVLLAAACSAAMQSPGSAKGEPPVAQPIITSSLPAPANPTPAAKWTVPIGAVVMVMTNEELSTQTRHVGDRFGVTVLQDVMDGPNIVIPKGTTGYGEVTFATRNGGFGKPGILSIALRYLDLDGARVLLDGRYREEGANKNGATVATWFAVGVFSGFIRGKQGVIPMGRELKAHLGEDVAVTPRPKLIAPDHPAATALAIHPDAESQSQEKPK